jgi:hypothetical protein
MTKMVIEVFEFLRILDHLLIILTVNDFDDGDDGPNPCGRGEMEGCL